MKPPYKAPLYTICILCCCRNAFGLTEFLSDMYSSQDSHSSYCFSNSMSSEIGGFLMAGMWWWELLWSLALLVSPPYWLMPRCPHTDPSGFSVIAVSTVNSTVKTCNINYESTLSSVFNEFRGCQAKHWEPPDNDKCSNIGLELTRRMHMYSHTHHKSTYNIKRFKALLTYPQLMFQFQYSFSRKIQQISTNWNNSKSKIWAGGVAQW